MRYLLLALVLLAGCATPRPSAVYHYDDKPENNIWLWLADDGTVRWSYAEPSKSPELISSEDETVRWVDAEKPEAKTEIYWDDGLWRVKDAE